MVITKISRTYSRSINTANYGGKESWVRVEATYEAAIESGDDPINVAKMMASQAQKDVADSISEVITKVKEAAAPKTITASGGPGTAPRPL